jgi:hypothetical protein
MVGLNENNLVTCQSGFVGNHKLELPKRPTVKLCPLLSTLPLTATSNVLKVFQNNKGIWRKAINEATANGVEIGSCPAALLVAQPFPSPLGSRAFALQGAPSGTKPLASLYQLYARNLKTVRSDKQVNLAEVNTNNSLRRVAWFRVGNENGNMQVKFSVPMTLKGGKGGFKVWQIALPHLNRALNPLAIMTGKANPNFIAFPKQAKKSCVQIQRISFEGQKFKGLLVGFKGLIGFGNTVTSTDSKVGVQAVALSDFSVSQMVQGNGIEAAPLKRNLTNGVTGFGENIKGLVQALLILWREVKFGDNGQIHKRHRLNCNIICKGGERRHSSVA